MTRVFPCHALFVVWIHVALVGASCSKRPCHYDGSSQSSNRVAGGAASQEVDCEMRSVAWDLAMNIPRAKRHAREIMDSLGLARDCPKYNVDFDDDQFFHELHNLPCCSVEEPDNERELDQEEIIYLDCENGNDMNDGTSKNEAVKSPRRAQIVSRELRKGEGGHHQVTIMIRGGTCYLDRPLTLTPDDSNVTWRAEKDDVPVFSGGALLSNLAWSKFTNDIFVADLPSHINAAAIDSLFALPSLPSKDILRQVRLVRARYPNGNSEVDRMPTNYDKLGGEVSSVEAWRIAGNESKRFPNLRRNSSFYPWFGHSKDERWVLDYHWENQSSYYEGGAQFWQPTIATAAKYNSTTFSPRVANWTNVQDGVLHVIHYDWWGNWQWRIKSVNTTSHTIEFGDGGWQDAHGGPVVHNYFFVENILQELDAPGEWYVDARERKLYYWPTAVHQRAHPSTWKFVASQLPVVVQTKATVRNPVHSVLMIGIAFSHSTTTYLAKRYTVPSAGDWSVLPQGAVTLRNIVNSSLVGCSWIQTGGNALALVDHVQNCSISDGDFVKIGDSAIVSVGRLPKRQPYNGYGVKTFPTNVSISRCHFGVTGVYGKQTSALFIANSKRIQFTDNVLYDGPRAGININDGFGGGHRLERNVIFNQVLESGDHGPLNTWSRSAYLQEGLDAKPTTTPEWNYIDRNFVMLGPKYGSLYGPGYGPCSNGDVKFRCPRGQQSLFACLDHDDGSSFYLDTGNVCAFVGMKNYIGENKIWDSNLILYPEGTILQNRSGMPCLWTSMGMDGDESKLPCTEITGPCRTLEVFTNNTCITTAQPLDYDMFNETDLALMGNKHTTIPYTAMNRYYLHEKYCFEDFWNLSEAQRHGVDVGSKEFPVMSPADIGREARNLLGLKQRRSQIATLSYS